MLFANGERLSAEIVIYDECVMHVCVPCSFWANVTLKNALTSSCASSFSLTSFEKQLIIPFLKSLLLLAVLLLL